MIELDIVESAGMSYYRPSTFAINIDPEYMESGAIKSEFYSIFMHEYGHLMQDCSTLVGVHTFLTHIDLMMETSNKINVPEFDTPISLPLLSTSFSDRIQDNQKFADLSNPNASRNYERPYQARAFDRIELEENDYLAYAVFLSATGRDVRQPFGIVEIKECQSMAIQEIYDGNTVNFPRNWKYGIVKEIIDHYFSGATPQHRFIFCLWALNSLKPGFQLSEILTSTRAQFGTIIPPVKELHNFLRNLFCLDRQRSSSFRQSLYLIIDLADKARKSGNDYLYNLLIWYAHGLESRMQYLTDGNFVFPLGTVFIEKSGNRFLTEKFLPIYCIYNRGSNETFGSAVEDKLIETFPHVLEASKLAIHHLFTKNSKSFKCPFFDMCPHSTSVCESNPWIKRKDAKKCMFGLASALLIGDK